MLSSFSQMNPIARANPEPRSSLLPPTIIERESSSQVVVNPKTLESRSNSRRRTKKSVRDPPRKLNHLLYNAVRDLNPSHGTSSRAATTGEAQQFRYRSTFSPSMVVVPGRVELGTIIKGKKHRRTRFTSLRIRHATECPAKGTQHPLSLDHLMCKSKIACLSFIG